MTCGLLTLASSRVEAELITTFDFSDDSTWNVTLTLHGLAVDQGSGVFDSGSTLYVNRTSAGAGDALQLSAELIGSISTAGFEDLHLTFESETTNGNMAFNLGTGSDGPIGDGFVITSTHGINFDTGLASSEFESVLDDGATWDAALAATFGQDLTFDVAVDDGEISNFGILLQINAGGEEMELRNFQLHGTSSLPEPSTLAWLVVLGLFGLMTRWARSGPG